MKDIFDYGDDEQSGHMMTKEQFDKVSKHMFNTTGQEAEPFASYFESSGNEDEGVPSIRKIDFGVRGGAWKPLYKHPPILAPLPQPSASSQDVEEFIAEKQRHNASLNHNAIHADDLRAWMAGHVRVPKEALIELVRISDRDHKVWNIVKEAIKES